MMELIKEDKEMEKIKCLKIKDDVFVDEEQSLFIMQKIYDISITPKENTNGRYIFATHTNLGHTKGLPRNSIFSFAKMYAISKNSKRHLSENDCKAIIRNLWEEYTDLNYDYDDKDQQIVSKFPPGRKGHSNKSTAYIFDVKRFPWHKYNVVRKYDGEN